MEDKEIRSFSLPALLIVTGISFLLFALGFRILDGAKMKFFFGIGFIIFFAGILAGACMLIVKSRTARSKMNC